MPVEDDPAATDAWRWRNENDAMNARAGGSGARHSLPLEEKRVGTAVASFEELLMRELAKSQQEQGTSTQELRSTNNNSSNNGNANGARRSSAVQKKPFLRKGDRGWWMERPDVRAKIHKHVLVSKDIDGAESSSSRATTTAASASLRSSTKKKSSRLSLKRQQSQVSDSSERWRRAEPQRQHAAPQRQPSPPPLSPPIRRTQHAPERYPPPSTPPPAARQSYNSYSTARQAKSVTQPQTAAVARLSDSMRTTTSIDTLGMSRVRQSYEEQLEREANELADFEAIERELAAEKDAYLKEKQQQQQQHDDEGDSDSFEEAKASPSWHYSSGSPHRQQQQQRRRPLQDETSFDSFDTAYDQQQRGDDLELDGHSSLLFDDDKEDDQLGEDDDFESASPFPADRRRISDHFGASRDPYAASELSAISLNDSESWDDQLSQQQMDGHQLKRDSGSSLLDAARSELLRGYGSFGNATPASFADQHQSQRRESDAFSIDDLYGSHDTTSEYAKPAPREEPPVSALMEQFFGGKHGGASSAAGADEDEQYDTSHDSDYYQNELAEAGSTSRAGFRPTKQLQTKSKSSAGSMVRSTAAAASSNRSARGGRTKGINSSVTARQQSAAAAANKPSSGTQSSTTGASAKARAGGPILPVVIEEKLFELEEEVKFYKSETLQLQKKKEFYEQAVKKLAREREEFVAFQNEQGVLIEKEWEKERLKMKREEKLMERQIKLKLSAAASHHDRKERGEIEALKAQIVKMQLDEKARASKWKAMNDNLRQRVGELEDKNRELSDEIKFLEKDRLEQWGKYESLLKEKQRPVEPPAPSSRATLGRSSNGSHFDLDSEREIRTVNDLFAIKDTAEELLKGWQSRQEDEVGSEQPTMTSGARNPFAGGVSSNASASGYQARQNQFSASRSAYDENEFATSRGHQEVAPYITSYSEMASSRSSQSTGGSVKDGDEDSDEDKQPGIEASTTRSSTPTHASGSSDPKRIAQEVVQPGGKRELIYSDGSKKIFFADGNEKEIDANGHTTIKFTNGDRKELFPDTGISIYYYYEAQTTLTTFPDKTKVYEFPNQQVEKSYPDGTTEISFADGITKTIRPNGDEFSVFPDGTTMLEQKDGLREVTLLNQKRVRYYPDGSMAWVTPQGKETPVRSDAELKKLMESL